MKYHKHQFGVDSQIDSEEAPADPSDGDESDSIRPKFCCSPHQMRHYRSWLKYWLQTFESDF